MRPEGLKNPKGAEKSAPFFLSTLFFTLFHSFSLFFTVFHCFSQSFVISPIHTTEYTEYLEQRSRNRTWLQPRIDTDAHGFGGE